MSAAAFKIPTIFTAIDKLTAPVDRMAKSLGNFASKSQAGLARLERGARKTSEVAMKVAKTSVIAAGVIAAPLVYAANSAVKFEDRMADVAKTTGLTGRELAGLGEDILQIAPKTRTPVEGLQKIAEIGGQMGIKGRAGILAFTNSVDKFNVALGSDFGGGVEEAARAIGSLNTLFKETRNLEVADAITKAGSAFNALSAQGVLVPELAEFTKRIGNLPDAVKPSIQDTAALGAVFNKVGITAEIASRAVGDVLLTATQNLPKFARQMGVSEKALAKLIDTDPTEFLKQFSAGFKGMKADQLGPLLKSLKLGDSGSIKVIGALSTNIGMLSEFQAIANKEFADGTSILNEYNVKNETTAAKLEKVKNNVEVFSIMLGTQLLPEINKLIAKITPVIIGISKWISENKPLTLNILKIAAVIAGLLFTLSAFATVVSIVSGAIAAWAAVQLWLNAVMLANPIGVVIALIVIFIGLIYLIIKYFNEWGAAINVIMAVFTPWLSLIISLIMTFYNNWEKIVDAFKNDGIIAGIKMIGATLLDAVLLPLSQILGAIAKLTGADWAVKLSTDLDKFRADLGLGDGQSAEKTADSTSSTPRINPREDDRMAYVRSVESYEKQNVQIDINDKTGRAKVASDNNMVPLKLSSTMNWR